MINGERLQENPETGITEQRLNHLDRILFGKNTIFVFRYPLMKRKLNEIKDQIRDDQMTEEELDAKALEMLLKQPLKNEESKDDEEEDNTWCKVSDYT